MSRMKEAFENKKAFIGFLTAGDPSLDKTIEFMVKMEEAGASLIEIGVPFSDPIAEGPVIQDANVRALSAPGGYTTDLLFDMLEKASKKVTVPLVLLTYLNPIFKYGCDAFCKRCKEVGIDGLIIPDMPYEEREEVVPYAEQYDIDVISFISPASEERIKMIAKEAKGYIYMLSAADAREEVVSDVADMVKVIREVTDLPVVTELEIQSSEQVAECEELADVVIPRNAIVKIIEQYGNDAGKPIYDFVKSMVDRLN